MLHRALVTLIAAAALLGCSSSSSSDAPPGGQEPALTPSRGCETVGATRCDGAGVSTCEEAADGSSAWSAGVACSGDQSCRDGACQDPTARQRAQAKSIETFVDDLAPFTAWHDAVDASAVKTRERDAVLHGDGTDAAFFGAAWRTLNAFPQGHQGLYSTEKGVCGKAMPYQNSSRFGVCGRPGAGGIVVTLAKPNNKLGLAAGDTIVKAGDDAGDALFAKAYERPVCGAVFPAASGRRYAAAASFFGTVPAGTKLVVTSAAGATREVVVPDTADAQATDCTDPFSRNRQIYAEATTRPDGVAVIRLPSFYPYDKQLSSNPTQEELDAFVAAYQGEIQKVFDSVKTAKAIVWDARGNTGGITKVGLAIVGGFPTAAATHVSYCKTRTASSSPPSYEGEPYAVYDVAPGGPFAYAGKVAVVTDGLAYSAGDYFPFAARKAANAVVVGSSTAGAYGGGHVPIAIDGPPALTSNYDPTACFDAVTNQPLEAAPLPPTAAVEYDPKDLAAGRDTVLERAVASLGL